MDVMLSAVLNPSSVAIIGASDNPHKVGGRPLLYLSKFGFKGRLYPINPHRSTVQGVRSYPDMRSLPEAPDLAVIATPGDAVMAAVGDCADRGVRAAIVMSSGYGETGDPQAVASELAMVRRARAAGMRLVGPNSQGLANFGTGTVASFSTMFLEAEPMDGPVAVISQSGMMSTVPYGLLRGMGLGVRHSHATGNEADVSLSEMALAVLDDPQVRLLLLYIESIRHPELLIRAAARARERDVPIVAVKTGRTARGQQAARSHTGALANEDRVVDAFFARHGIWRVDDIHELVSASALYLAGWRPANRRMVVVSNSGASCVMAADSSESVGLELAALSTETVRTLTAELPSFATATNPIDITAALLTDSALLGRMLKTLAIEPAVDVCLVALPVVGQGYDVPLFARDAASFIATTGKPLVVAAPQENVAAVFRSHGVPVFANQTEAVKALGQLVAHASLMRESPPAAVVREAPLSRVAEGADQFLSEMESLELLEQCGLPVVERYRCRTLAEALQARQRVGGPVVMKGCAAAVPHKSEHGLVCLNVKDDDDVERAYAQLTERLAALGARGEILVAPMIDGPRIEMMLGAKIDPVLGPVLMIGHGGTYVEALDDVQLLMPPITPAEARRAISRLRVAKLLGGVRGEAPRDVEALCAAAVRLGEIITQRDASMVAIDINPVLVGERGRGAVIVDALIERQPAAMVTT